MTTGMFRSLASCSTRAIAFGLPAETARPSTPFWSMSCAICTSDASSYSCGPMKVQVTFSFSAAALQPACNGGVKALFSTLNTIAKVLACAGAAAPALIATAPAKQAPSIRPFHRSFLALCDFQSSSRPACTRCRNTANQDEQADKQPLPERIDPDQQQRVAYFLDQHGADDGAVDGAVAAGKAGAANHGRGDHAQLVAGAERVGDRAEPADQEQGRRLPT